MDEGNGHDWTLIASAEVEATEITLIAEVARPLLHLLPGSALS